MYLKRLSDKIWLTRNARFTASRRMKRSRIASTAAVALLSASVIGINLLAYLPNVGDDIKNIITIGTIILSTFVLVLSLLITMLRYEWREDNYHRCAMELEHLNQQILIRIDELNAGNRPQEEIVSPRADNERFLEEYTGITEKYNLNHTTFDYRYGRLSDSNLRVPCSTEISLQLRYHVFDVYLLYWLVSIASLVPIVYLALTVL